MIFLRGSIDLQGTMLEDISRKAVSGVAFRDDGKKADETDLTGVVDVTTPTAAKAMVATMKALQGTLVTIVESTGQQYTNVAVKKVISPIWKFAGTPSGGINGGEYLVSATFRVQMTEIS